MCSCSLRLIFTLVAASISNFFTDAIKVSCFSSSEIGLKQSKNFEVIVHKSKIAVLTARSLVSLSKCYNDKKFS